MATAEKSSLGNSQNKTTNKKTMDSSWKFTAWAIFSTHVEML